MTTNLPTNTIIYLVYSLLLIDVLQTVITTWSSWVYVIESWGNLAALAIPPRSVIAIPLFSSIGV